MGAKIKQPHLKMYFKEGRDLELRAALERDIRKGKGSASSIARQALMEHYGLLPRPALPDPALRQLAAQTERLAQMTDALAQLTGQVAALQGQVAQLVTLVAQQAAQVAALQAENQQLRQLLLAATFGDKSARQQAERAALALVRPGNGGNGHE